VLPIYRKINIHVLVANILASCLLAILANVYQQLSHFRSMTVRPRQFTLYSPYHPSRHLPECCYPLGNLIPAASHPNVAIDACAGRLLMMEHEINSVYKRTINSYLDSLVSHLTLPITSRKYTQGGSFPMNFLRSIAFQILISCQRSTEPRLAGILLLLAVFLVH